MRRIVTRSNPQPTEAVIQHQLSILTQDNLESYARQLEPLYHEEIERKYRLLSLSDSPDNHHLWVNYSDNYAGICFRFFFTPAFASVYRVNYVKNRPKWDLVSEQDMETLSNTTLTKMDSWKDEREFRMVLSESSLPYGRKLIDQKLVLPLEVFFGIYLGYRINKSNKNLIIDSIRQSLPHAPIFSVAEGSTIVHIL